MKKIAFLLAFVMLFMMCGCGGNKGEELKELEVDIEYFAKLGQMPE